VMNASARATLTPQATTSVVYLSIMNHGGTDDKLLSVSTPNAKSATLHENQVDGEVMKMREIEGGLDIGAGQTVDLEPGGQHIMLMGLSAPLKQGDSLPLDLLFEKAGHLQLNIPVGVAAAPHQHID
jgi:periplasmic copper chaperone A